MEASRELRAGGDPLSGLPPHIFENEAVQRLLERRMATREGRISLFRGLAEHEAEGVRFLSAADRLGREAFHAWDRDQHLRDERRHVAYFMSLLRAEAPEAALPVVAVEPLSPSEQTVFENAQEFLISLYVAERFSACYLAALRRAVPHDLANAGAIDSVLARALADEEKHSAWVLSAVERPQAEEVRARMRRFWCDFEIAFLDTHAHG